MKLIIIGLISISIIIIGLGVILPNERSARRKVTIKASPEKLFETVTNLSNQSWRSDVGVVEVVDTASGQEVWIEKPKRGPEIKFRTKVKTPPNRFGIEIIDNENFSGNWIGTFTPKQDGETEVDFAEHLIVQGFIPKLMSYLFFNVDKAVETYIEDLRKATEEPR